MQNISRLSSSTIKDQNIFSFCAPFSRQAVSWGVHQRSEKRPLHRPPVTVRPQQCWTVLNLWHQHKLVRFTMSISTCSGVKVVFSGLRVREGGSVLQWDGWLWPPSETIKTVVPPCLLEDAWRLCASCSCGIVHPQCHCFFAVFKLWNDIKGFGGGAVLC